MKQRDISVDIMKCLAVFAITNSHMDLLYGKYASLATGGAIGDAMFFFVSGYTILLGGVRTFGNYYKRRINRIYPTVLAWAVMSCVVFGNEDNIVNILLYGGGWFVTRIMTYYVVFFFIQKYCINHLKIILVSCFIASSLLYIPFSYKTLDFLRGSGYGYYHWFQYFIFMLQGSMIGLYAKHKAVVVNNGWYELLKVIICVMLFFGVCLLTLDKDHNYNQTLSILPLFGITYYTYRMCNAVKLKKLYSNTKLGLCMGAIGGLCLEVYLVQYSLFTDKLNFLFPLNLIIIFIEILFVAYILRCMGRIWSQTFKDADYNWKEVFKVV